MKYELEVQEEAWIDIEVAHDWYEQQRKGLGEEFIEEVENCFLLISAHPERFGYFKGSKVYRRIILSRFPYRVIFEVEKHKVIVNCVTHVKKNKI